MVVFEEKFLVIMQKSLIALVFCVLLYTVCANSSTKKDSYTNFMNSNRSNDITINSSINNPPEGKSNEFFNKYIENVRTKNKQMNLKMVQNLNQDQSKNGDYTKLKEKLRRQMMNMTASRQYNTPEYEAPTMIPIFRPLLNNIRNKAQPTDEKVSKDLETFNNTEEYDNEVIYLKSVTKDESEDESVNNSTNGVKILNLADTISLLKQQQNALNFQQVNLQEPINNENNPLQPLINVGIGNDQIAKTVSSENEEKVLELKDIVYPNNVFTSVQSMFLPQTGVIDSNNAVSQKNDFKIHPQFKIEYIPDNNKWSPNQNTQNLITLSESLNPSADDINTIQNVITQNLGLPNNMIIESMKFISLSEMQNNLRNSQSVFQDPSIETVLEKQIFEENAATFQRDYEQVNPVTSNTKFEIPCFTATDILEDFGRYNPTLNQNTMQPIIFSETEHINTNFPCTNEAGKDNIDEDSVAIIFKPKNISLLKLYGDILKKITLTVLVPYHVSKLVA